MNENAKPRVVAMLNSHEFSYGMKSGFCLSRVVELQNGHCKLAIANWRMGAEAAPIAGA